MSEIWISHYSVANWGKKQLWTTYFQSLEKVAGLKLHQLDTQDPPKRLVDSSESAAQFAVDFDTAAQSRWLFAKSKTGGYCGVIHHHRSTEGNWNSIRWSIPAKTLDKPSGVQKIRALFDLGNEVFSPFYSIADLLEEIGAKQNPDGAVDLESELPGIFWLTYFNRSYCSFFGEPRLRELPAQMSSDSGGVTISLGDDPRALATGVRSRAEVLLGRDSFVDPHVQKFKRPGDHALTAANLLATQGERDDKSKLGTSVADLPKTAL